MKFKTRLTKGTTGKVFHRLYSKQRRKAYLWAMNLQPGDIFNSFDAWNHEVTGVEVQWHDCALARLKRERYPDEDLRFGLTPKGQYVQDVKIFSTDGWVHFISESGCIVPAFSVEDLKKTFTPEIYDFFRGVGAVDPRGIKLRSITDEEKVVLEKIKKKQELKYPWSNEWISGPPYPKLKRYYDR